MTLKYAQTVSSQVSQTGRSYILKKQSKNYQEMENYQNPNSNCNLGSDFWAPKQTNNRSSLSFIKAGYKKILSLNKALVPWLFYIKSSQQKSSYPPSRGSTTPTPFPLLCTTSENQSRWRLSTFLHDHFSEGSLHLNGLCHGCTSLSAVVSCER